MHCDFDFLFMLAAWTKRKDNKRLDQNPRQNTNRELISTRKIRQNYF